MGERRKRPLRVSFEGQVKLEFPGARFSRNAAFSNPEIYEFLEEEHFFYAIRVKGNNLLHQRIAHLTTRPVGRPSVKPKICYASFRYQAHSWRKARRVVAEVEWHAGEPFPRDGLT